MTPSDEAEALLIELWNQGLEIATIAERLGIPRGTVSSRATALRKRGVALAKRPQGGAYPSQRAKARQEGPPAPVQSGAEQTVMHGAQSVQISAVHAHDTGAQMVQTSAEPPIPATLAAELGRLWAAIDALRQDIHRPVHETVQSLPEPLFDDPVDNATERWNLYLKHGLRVQIEAVAQARGVAPSRVVTELLFQALCDRRASTHGQ